MKRPLREVVGKDELRRIYNVDGLSMKDIAKKFGYSKRAVMNTMNFYGIERCDKDEARHAKVATIQEKLPKEKLIRMYIDEQMSTTEISREVGSTPSAVSRIMDRYGIKARNKAEELTLRHSQNRGINEQFFEIPSHDLYYVMGVIASDGNIGENGSISLQMNDEDVIRYVAEKMEYTNKVSKSERDGVATFRIKFTSHKAAGMLASYGIVSRKTTTLEPPLGMPEQYIPDFIRGVFDGDGTISLSRAGSSRFRVGIVGASRVFMEWIKEVVDMAIDHDVKMTEDRRGNTVYMYYFGTPDRIHKFGNYIYGTDFEKFGMGRKKERFIRNITNLKRPSQA